MKPVTHNVGEGELNSMLHRCFVFEAYIWEDKIVMVQWLTKQILEDSIDNAVSDNIRCLQRENVLQQDRSMIQDNPKVAMDFIVHVTQHNYPEAKVRGHTNLSQDGHVMQSRIVVIENHNSCNIHQHILKHCVY
uniref:Uncharacterized protein n=1 Tax=Magallana gigas TaxID=29159 RepID=A0A8W8JLJ5_MAGGI